MRARWAPPLLLALHAALAAGCFTTKAAPAGEDEDIATQRGACSAFEGIRFESLSKQECGLTPDGTASCHWHVTLDLLDRTRSTYEWQYSDVVESGAVTCNGRQIEVVEGPRGAGPIGIYDDATGELTWNGIVYIRTN